MPLNDDTKSSTIQSGCNGSDGGLNSPAITIKNTATTTDRTVTATVKLPSPTSVRMSSSDITKSSFENNISDNCKESNSTATTATHASSSLSKNEKSSNDVASSTAATSNGNYDKAAAVNKDDAAAPSTDGVEGQFGTIESSLEPNPVPTLKPSERKILLETSDSNDAFDGASPSNAGTPSESGNSATSPTNSNSVENGVRNSILYYPLLQYSICS